MELEYIANVEICDAIGINFVSRKSEVHLLRVEVDIRSNGCVCFAVDSLTQQKSSDKIGADDLPGSLAYGDRKRSRLRVGNRLKPLALLAASDVFIDESAHEWPPIVTLDQFQYEIMAWVSGCDRIVALFQNLAADLQVVGYVELPSVVH